METSLQIKYGNTLILLPLGCQIQINELAHLLCPGQWFPHWRTTFREVGAHAQHTEVRQQTLAATAESRQALGVPPLHRP